MLVCKDGPIGIESGRGDAIAQRVTPNSQEATT